MSDSARCRATSVTAVRAIVVGAGAWGLPAAAALASRGHEVTVLDAYGIGGPLASSSGTSRIWRTLHQTPRMVRLGGRAVEAMTRLEEAVGRPLRRHTGLLWRDPTAGRMAAIMAGERVAHDVVSAEDVGFFVPGLRPTGVDALWQADAGPLLAREVLLAAQDILEGAGGLVLEGVRVTSVEAGRVAVRVGTAAAGVTEADVVVLAPGPGAPALLPQVGVDLPLQPRLAYAGFFATLDGRRDGSDDWPCFIDGATDDAPGIYALPGPGIGYKVGFDLPMRPVDFDEKDRTALPSEIRRCRRRVSRDFRTLEPQEVDRQTCTWTNSPDHDFVVDRVADGRVVVAVGDSGTGFKFAALMGELLADLAEGREVDEDVRGWGLGRFTSGTTPGRSEPDGAPLFTLGS